MSEDGTDALTAALDERLPELFREHAGGSMLSKWVVLAEVIEPSGDRALWCQAPAGQKAWETVGMLGFAQGLELAQTVRGENGEQ